MTIARRSRVVLLAAGVWSLAGNAAGATTIGFDTLEIVGPSPLPDFTAYTEDGFSVTAASGNWFTSLYGDPGPGIGAFNFAARTLTVAKGGSPFRFASVALDAFLVDAPYTFIGTLGGTTQFAMSGLSPGVATATFATAVNPDPSVIDTLMLTVGGTDYPYYIALDNIVVNDAAVSEPAPLAILACGLGGLWLLRGHRRPSRPMHEHAAA